MERVNRHPVGGTRCRDIHQTRQAIAKLAGRLDGEGDGHNPLGCDPILNKAGDAVDDHAGLASSRSGEHDERAGVVRDGPLLGGVESFEGVLWGGDGHGASLRRYSVEPSAARGHSAFLLDTDLFQHEDSRGRPFWERVLEAGYPGYRRLSENLVQVSGCTTDTARQAVNLWMTSTPHRANLLDKKIRFVGVGVAATSDCSVVDITADHGS